MAPQIISEWIQPSAECLRALQLLCLMAIHAHNIMPMRGSDGEIPLTPCQMPESLKHP